MIHEPIIVIAPTVREADDWAKARLTGLGYRPVTMDESLDRFIGYRNHLVIIHALARIPAEVMYKLERNTVIWIGEKP